MVGASYTLDAVGNRATKAAAGAPPEAYSYDAADRLVRVERTGPQSQLASFAYDPVGNRTTTQVGGTSLTGAFGLTNQLQSLAVGGSVLVSGTLSEPGTAVVNGQPARMLKADSFEASVPVAQGTQTISVSATDQGGRTRTNSYEVDISGAPEAFTYDANGSLIQRTIGPETWTYQWNGRNELAKVNKNGVELARFTYDPLGRRIEKATAGTVYSYAASGLRRPPSVAQRRHPPELRPWPRNRRSPGPYQRNGSGDVLSRRWLGIHRRHD